MHECNLLETLFKVFSAHIPALISQLYTTRSPNHCTVRRFLHVIHLLPFNPRVLDEFFCATINYTFTVFCFCKGWSPSRRHPTPKEASSSTFDFEQASKHLSTLPYQRCLSTMRTRDSSSKWPYPVEVLS